VVIGRLTTRRADEDRTTSKPVDPGHWTTNIDVSTSSAYTSRETEDALK
jgi:hypothetical protein